MTQIGTSLHKITEIANQDNQQLSTTNILTNTNNLLTSKPALTQYLNLGQYMRAHIANSNNLAIIDDKYSDQWQLLHRRTTG